MRYAIFAPLGSTTHEGAYRMRRGGNTEMTGIATEVDQVRFCTALKTRVCDAMTALL